MCYRGSLEKVQENPKYKGKGGLTAKMQQRLTSAAHCAIKMRRHQQNCNEAINKLQSDLQNGPYHVAPTFTLVLEVCRTKNVQVAMSELVNMKSWMKMKTLPDIAANQVWDSITYNHVLCG